MSDRTRTPVDGLDDYLERLASHPRPDRTDIDAALRRRPLRRRYQGPLGVAVFTALLTAVLAVAVVHHQDSESHSGNNATATTKNPQLNMLLRTVIGSGSATTDIATFPYARYTFYTYEDPANCVLGVQLQDADGRFVAGDRVARSHDPNTAPETFNVALYKTNVQAGDYKVRIITTAVPCAWRLQEILNSMSSDQAPPPAEDLPQAPDFAATITSANAAQSIDIPTAGLYAVRLTLTLEGGACTGFQNPFGTQSQYGFRNAAGQFEVVLGGVSDQPPHSTATPAPTAGLDQGQPVFLAAGKRTVQISTNCGWRLAVQPWHGPTGGGSQGFAPQPSPEH